MYLLTDTDFLTPTSWAIANTQYLNSLKTFICIMKLWRNGPTQHLFVFDVHGFLNLWRKYLNSSPYVHYSILLSCLI